MRDVRHNLRFWTNIFSLTCFLLSGSCQNKKPVFHTIDPWVRDSLNLYWSIIRESRLLNLKEAKHASRKAIRLAEQKGNISDRSFSFLQAGSVYITDDPDSNLLLTKAALVLSKQNKEDTILQHIFYNLAFFNFCAFNYNEALLFLDSAWSYSNQRNDFRIKVQIMVMMGQIDRDQDNNIQARENFMKALTMAEPNNMTIQKGVILGNFGSIAQNRDSAVAFIRSAIRILSTINTAREEQTSLLMNLANYITCPDSAIQIYKDAINLAKAAKLDELMIAAYNNLGCTYMEMNKLDLARVCFLDQAVPLAKKTNNASWLSTVYGSCAELMLKNGDFKNAYEYQRQAMQCGIEANQKLSSSQTRLLNSLLMAKNREMELRNKTDEIRAKRDLVKLLLLIIIGVSVIALFIMFYFILKIQRKNLRIKTQEIESAKRLAQIEEKENARISMQLHDAIRPLTSVLLKEIETISFADPQLKESVTSKIRHSARQLRSISHRLNPEMREQMSFNELIRSIKEDSGDWIRKMAVAGVRGYVIKDAPRNELRDAIMKVAAGRTWFTELNIEPESRDINLGYPPVTNVPSPI